MSTFLSVEESANELKVSPQRIRTLCRTNALTTKKVGSVWIVDASSLYRYGLQTAHIIAEDHGVYDCSGVKSDRKPMALSFFSGAMGLDLGLEKAGFDVRLACESDKFCRQTIALNRPETALLGDINDHEAEDILSAAGLSREDDIDLVVGGPPCQAFSTAGKRKGFKDDRGNVFLRYVDLAIALNPKFIVIENVRGLLSCPLTHRPHDQRGEGFPDLSEDELKGGALNFVLSKLKRAHYSYSFNLYNAANYGTPQTRERVVIVCARDTTHIPYIPPTHSEHGEFGLPKWKTLNKIISGMSDHNHLDFPEKRLKYYRLLKPGQNWRNLPEALQKEAMGKSYYAGGGKTGFFRRLAWDKPSPTLLTHPAMPATDLAHPTEDRPLSIQEYKRIQEFPDGWQLAGPLVQQYKQVGNAVPLSLGYAVGKLIQSLLKAESVPEFPAFKYSRYKNTSQYRWALEFERAAQARNPQQVQVELLLGQY